VAADVAQAATDFDNLLAIRALAAQLLCLRPDPQEWNRKISTAQALQIPRTQRPGFQTAAKPSHFRVVSIGTTAAIEGSLQKGAHHVEPFTTRETADGIFTQPRVSSEHVSVVGYCADHD
jgi:hypothetical protein